MTLYLMQIQIYHQWPNDFQHQVISTLKHLQALNVSYSFKIQGSIKVHIYLKCRKQKQLQQTDQNVSFGTCI